MKNRIFLLLATIMMVGAMMTGLTVGVLLTVRKT